MTAAHVYKQGDSQRKQIRFLSFVTVLYIAEFITGFMAGLLAYASTQIFAFSSILNGIMKTAPQIQ